MRPFFLLSIFCFSAILYAKNNENNPKRTYHILHINEGPRIDGKLDDVCWSEGKWDGNFTQQIPNSGHKPSQETFIKLLYDHDYIYVGIKCMDSEPEKIRQIFNRRDEFSGDIVGIAFDSYFDQQTAFEFNVTAAGQKIDLKHFGDGDHDRSWNAIWDAETSINSQGWVAEIKIPFSQLRYSPGQEIWGMHVWRWIDRYQEESQWQLIPKDSPAMVYLFGELSGIQNIRDSRQMEFLPYASAQLDYKGDQNPYQDQWKAGINGGVDAKIGISSNFTLDATINPDFGQVEADPSELNLTTFETYFREKRPFFLEGSEIFDLRIDRDRLFYSRRVGSQPGFTPELDEGEYLDLPNNTTILGSLKLTGKSSKGMSVGLMNSVTAKEYAKIYSATGYEDVAIEPLTNYFAGRIKQEINGANTIFGASFNSVYRNSDEQHLTDHFNRSAFSGGIDFTQYFNNRNYFFTGKLLGSYLEGSQSSIYQIQQSHLHRFDRYGANHLKLDSLLTQLSGVGGTLRLGKQGGQLQYGIKGSFWSPGLNINDIGFSRVSDKVEQQAWISFESLESSSFFRKYYIELDNKINSSFGGEITANELGIESRAELNNLWNFFAKGEISFPSFDTRVLRGGPALLQEAYGGLRFRLQSNGSKKIVGNVFGGYWHSFRNPTNYYAMGAGFHYNPINQFYFALDAEYSKNYDNYQYVGTYDLGNNELIYLLGTIDRDNLNLTFRAEYYINPEFSIQYYASPYFSVGEFSAFKRVAEPNSKDQEDRYHFYNNSEFNYNQEKAEYLFSDSNFGDYSIENPDFSFSQLRSNLILRWEYKLGSIFYLVWSHEQTNAESVSMPGMRYAFDHLFFSQPNDVLLVKFSYWFSV